MLDQSFLFDLFSSVNESLSIVEERFSKIHSAEDFISSKEGHVLLDSISMRLQFIGETIKKIEHLNPDILQEYNQIKWGDIIHFRDFISHHYELLDHRIIFRICQIDIPELKKATSEILGRLKNS